MRFQLNIDKLMFETDGVWDMPLLEATQTTFTGAEEVIPFNYAITERQPQNKGVHFFLDDDQFERVWMVRLFLPELRDRCDRDGVLVGRR